MRNKKRYKLFSEYITEIRNLMNKTIEPNEIHNMFQEIKKDMRKRNTEWIDIGDVGFIIVGKSPNCNPSCDYYIEECYITPEYRRQGLMTETIKDYVTDHNGTYCMFIINENAIAKKFWESLFIINVLNDRFNNNENCTQYWFKC